MGCKVFVLRRKPYVKPLPGGSFRGVKFVDLWCPRTAQLEAITHTALGVLVATARRTDVLHVHCVGPALCVPLARLLGLKVIFTTQGPDYEREKWGPFAKAMLRLGERLGVRYAHRTISVSEHIRQSLKEKYGIESELIPNGVEIPSRPPGTRYLRQWGLECGKYVFSLGRFVPEKGFHDLIDAFSGIETDWRLAIAGQADHPSPYSRSLEASAARTQGVVLTGLVTGEPLGQLYAHCGLFVLPSYHEGLPLALLEALGYGASVLVSDIPANRSVPLPADRFFKSGDVEDLRQKMSYWMARGITEEERQQNLRMLRERFDWDAIARRTLEVYRRVLRLPQPA